MWKYLCSEPFSTRHLIAAHFLKSCTNVVEIGGFLSPIWPFLTHKYKKYVNVDPLARPHRKKAILEVATDYRDFDFSPYLSNYGLVMMGMEMPLTDKLIDIVKGAKTIIMEFSYEHEPSKRLFLAIEKELSLPARLKVKMDLTSNQFGDLKGSFPPFPKRELLVFKEYTEGT